MMGRRLPGRAQSFRCTSSSPLKADRKESRAAAVASSNRACGGRRRMQLASKVRGLLLARAQRGPQTSDLVAQSQPDSANIQIGNDRFLREAAGWNRREPDIADCEVDGWA